MMRELRGMLAERVVVPNSSERARHLTAMRPDPRRTGALRIEIDGAAFGAIAKEDAPGLVVGAELDELTLERLHTAADAEAGVRAALQMLARRPFARSDLGRRLRKRGHTATAVATAIMRLDALGLTDDAAFARQFAAVRQGRGQGPSRIARELSMLGVAQEIVSATIAEAAEAGDDDDTPSRLIATRLRQLGDLPATTLKRRILMYLARRGYTGSKIQKLVRDAVAARAEDAA